MFAEGDAEDGEIDAMARGFAFLDQLGAHQVTWTHYSWMIKGV